MPQVSNSPRATTRALGTNSDDASANPAAQAPDRRAHLALVASRPDLTGQRKPATTLDCLVAAGAIPAH